MGAENDFCCEAVRRRHAETNGAKKKNGTYKEEMKNAAIREKKINKTQVSFFDFWYECIDWDMIKVMDQLFNYKNVHFLH